MKTDVLSKELAKPSRKIARQLRRAVLCSGTLQSPAMRFPEMSPVKGFLPIDAYDFACVTREKRNGRTVRNRCLRDALWFVLHYYYPTLFGDKDSNPQFVESARLFGSKIPDWFPIAGGTQCGKICEALAAFRIRITVNGKEVRSNVAVVNKLIARFVNPFGLSFEKAIDLVKKALFRAEPCVIFAPIDSLMDHALFIHGVDAGNLYCIDTHQVSELTYWNTSGDPNRFTMQFSLKELEARWNRLGMVWSFHPVT